MIQWKIITFIFAVTVLVGAKSNHHQKRDTTFSICDPVYNNTNKVQCYCIKDHNDPKLVRSADCYLTSEGVTRDDRAWSEFRTIKNANKLIITNTRGITLTYIPTTAIKLIDNLVKLDIKYANLGTVQAFAFANLSTLEDITLRDNQIKTLEVNAFANHRNIIVISLDSNNVVEINRNVFVDLPHIEKLYLTSNNITTIHDKAFVHLTNLKELEIDRNSLFSLNSETFSGLKNLERLDISTNGLEVIGDNTFLPLTNLKSLNLDDNKIQMLDDKAFNGLANLQSLSLARNKLTDFDNAKVFEGMKSLILLSLRGNQIHQLTLEVMQPILVNFYGSTSNLDVEDNSFPCNCHLDWFMTLMNKTQNAKFKLAIENLKCLPDTKLREAWLKTVETDKNAQDGEESPTQGNDYEYYDDTQLNGKLFYVDIRDLLNCSKIPQHDKAVIDTPKINVTTETTKAISSLTTTTTVKTTSTTMLTQLTTTTMRPATITTTTTAKPTTKQLVEQQPTTQKIKENNSSTSKLEQYTTTRLATVSDNPLNNNIYHNMASDQAKPDRIKAHRSIQDLGDAHDHKGNGANANFASVTILTYLLYITFTFN